MNLYWPYLAPLIVVVMMTLSTGVATMRRTALVLFFNWLVNTLFVLTTQVYDPWAFFLAVDALSAMVLLYQPAGRVQAVVGGLYMAQIMTHGIYGACKNFAAPSLSVDNYLQILDMLGFVQLILLGGWAGGHWVRVAYRAWHRRRARVAEAQAHSGLA